MNTKKRKEFGIFQYEEVNGSEIHQWLSPRARLPRLSKMDLWGDCLQKNVNSLHPCQDFPRMQLHPVTLQMQTEAFEV